MPQDSPQLPPALAEQQRPGRPIADATVAVVDAADAIKADAVMLRTMLQDIRSGWLWALLTKTKP